MDKQKQIKEIMKALKDYNLGYINDDKYLGIAEYLYNANCRLITDGDVFFTKEQWEKLTEKN